MTAMTGTSLAERNAGEMRMLRFLGAVTVLAVLLPYAIVVETPSTALPWQGTVAVMIYSGLRLSGLYALGEPRLYSVVTWTFTYVFMGLAATLQLRLGVAPDTTPYLADWTLRRAVTIVIVGLVALEAGLALGGRNSGSNVVATATRAPRVLTRSSVALFSLSTFAACAYIVGRTGPAAYLANRTELGLAKAAAFPNPTLSAVSTGITLAFPLVAFHALVLFRRSERREGRKAPLLLTTVAMGALLLATTNPVSSPRILFGTVLLSLAVLAGATRTPQRTGAFILALLVGIILLLPAADAFRRDDVSTSSVSSIQIDPGQLASSGDYDAFAQTANSAFYVQVNGESTHGRQALGVLLFWVPRNIWQNKPEDSGVVIASARGYLFTNLSAPLWAEGYINGGLVGVALFMGGFGWLIRRGDRTFTASQSQPRPAAILGAILPFYVLIVLRGSLLQAAAVVAILFASTWAVGRRSS